MRHMPAKNPRLSVVLSPALVATLTAISEETGESTSSIVREVLTQAAPAFERMLQLVRAAKAAQGQIGAGLAESLGRVVDDLQDALAVADSRQARAVADLVDQAQAIKGRRRPGGGAGGAGGTARAAPTPVPVTRGSGGGKTLQKGVRRGSV